MNNLTSLCVLLACLILAPITRAFDLHQGVPPPELLGFEKTSRTFEWDNGVQGRVEFNGKLKRLYGRWRHGDDRHTQEIATSYYPTSVFVLAPTKWVVAGKRVRGATVIELWTVQKPLLVYANGENEPPLIQPAQITQIDEIYDEGVEGRDMVQGLCVKKGTSSNVVMVQFYDSKDIYELDLTTQGLTLVASPTVQTSGVLHVPEADGVWRQFWSSEHVSRGYVYVLASSGTPAHPVILEDTDKDGDLDLYVVSTNAIWSSTYSDASNYVQ